MSYNYKSHERIRVPYHGSTTVSYPASEHGGSKTVYYDGTVEEDVYVNIHVDTDEFDSSVKSCTNQVNVLTGAVTATEAAQVLSVDTNSKKVAKTIVSGFFSLINSEITQQISELTSQLNSQLIHLQKLASRCKEKQEQMKVDYQRIKSRYSKLFEDLNNELENRIFELDKPTFTFYQKINEIGNRATGTDMVSASIVSSGENELLQSQILVSSTKKSALESIRRAENFLRLNKIVQTTLDECIMTGGDNCKLYTPVCYMETSAKDGIQHQIFNSCLVGDNHDVKEMEMIQMAEWKPLSKEHEDELMKYLKRNILDNYDMPDKHQERVKAMMEKISQTQSINSI